MEISNIENKLTELKEKYPDIMQKSMDGDMSIARGDDMSMPSDQSGADKMAEAGQYAEIPRPLRGKDLDGNPVKSDELFSGNAVTVVNSGSPPVIPAWASFQSGRTEQGTRGRRAAHLSVSTPSHWTATRQRFPRRRTCWPRRVPPIRMYFDSGRRGGKVHYKHFCLSHHLWLTATAILWATPS